MALSQIYNIPIFNPISTIQHPTSCQAAVSVSSNRPPPLAYEMGGLQVGVGVGVRARETQLLIGMNGCRKYCSKLEPTKVTVKIERRRMMIVVVVIMIMMMMTMYY